MKHLRLLALAVLCLAVASLFISVAAASADPVGVSGDRTCLTIDPGVNRALLAAGILVKPLDPGVVESDWIDCKPTITFTFPVTDGVIDPGTLAGSIEHSGGLLFLNTANGASLTATAFRIDTAGAKLLGLVGDSYVPLLDLDLGGITVNQCGSVVRISNVVASLTDVAAGALNATLDTDLFAGGLTLGVARVKVRMPAEGQTVLCLDQAISQALAGSAIMVMPIKTGETWPLMPVWMNAPEGYLEECFRFPITGHNLTLSSLAGRIWHGGGLRFYNAANGRYLRLTSFKIDTAAGVLSACVCDSRVPIFDLDLSAIDVYPVPPYGAIYHEGIYAMVGNVGCALTETAAMALNAKLKTDLFAPGLKIGEATVEIVL
jgi:hypothetical protein